jgi:hypothetical protein
VQFLKKFQMFPDTLASFVQGNLGWAYMQQNNFLSAEAVYRSVSRFSYASLGTLSLPISRGVGYIGSPFIRNKKSNIL